jgi:putative transposase
MKTSRYTEAQILAILRQAEGGVPVAELCREHGMSNASFYKWRAKYGGMDASLISQMKAMEDENRRLKRMYADLSMQADLLKEALGKKSLPLQWVLRKRAQLKQLHLLTAYKWCGVASGSPKRSVSVCWPKQQRLCCGVFGLPEHLASAPRHGFPGSDAKSRIAPRG